MIRPISPIDRAAFLAKWADRLILTRQPVCPDCGRLIPPAQWDAHRTTCTTTTTPKEGIS